MILLKELAEYIENNTITVFSEIPEERKAILNDFASGISRVKGKIQLTFICTHNSRRSHLGQIWAQTAAYYYGIKNIQCFSGGTEVTAFNPRAVRAVEEAGFNVTSDNSSDNPEYSILFAEDQPALKCFSKIYDDPFNPQNEFIAVMTCNNANEACPVVAGASEKIAVMYRDPKEADDTPEEKARYAERCEQVGREMFYVFSQVKQIKHG